MPNRSLMIVLVTVMINMMGVGLAWPILPKLVEELTGGSVSQVAGTYGLIAVIFSFMQFAVAPFLGILSDRYGRRPVMLVALTGLGLDNILMAIGPTIEWMFVARLLGGAFAASYSIANAYVADTMAPDDRAKGFGMIGAAFGVGFIIGPLVGGTLGEIDIRLPFWFAAGLSFINVIFGWFFLVETLPPENRKPRSLREANPLTAIKWMTTTTGLIALATALFIANTMQRGLESIWVLFSQHQYGWGMLDAGISLAIVGVSFIFVQGYLVGKVVPWLGEVRTMVLGFSFSAIFYYVLAFNTVGLWAYLGIIPNIIGWGCASTALQSLASRRVEASQQGFLQGAMGGITGLASISGPMISTSTFAYFTSEFAPVDMPGAYFLLGGTMLLVAAWVGGKARA